MAPLLYTGTLLYGWYRPGPVCKRLEVIVSGCQIQHGSGSLPLQPRFGSLPLHRLLPTHIF